MPFYDPAWCLHPLPRNPTLQADSTVWGTRARFAPRPSSLGHSGCARACARLRRPAPVHATSARADRRALATPLTLSRTLICGRGEAICSIPTVPMRVQVK